MGIVGRTGSGKSCLRWEERISVSQIYRKELLNARPVPVRFLFLFSWQFDTHSIHDDCSMVELRSGKIEIDGVNIGEIGLDALRSRLAVVPQDSTLFLGTLRENLYVSRSKVMETSKLTCSAETRRVCGPMQS